MKNGKKKMKAYLFDFDGTLVDSMPSFIRMMKSILDESGIKYADDTVKIITPLGYGGAAEHFISLGMKSTREDLIKEMIKRAHEDYVFRINAKDGVVNALKVLKERGHSLNVLTASPHTMLDPCLKRNGIFELFDNVWSCEDFGTTKSDPEIYRAAAERIGIDVKDLVFLDDNVFADKTAKSAGAYVIGVYDESSADYVDEMKDVCDEYVYSFRELI